MMAWTAMLLTVVEVPDLIFGVTPMVQRSHIIPYGIGQSTNQNPGTRRVLLRRLTENSRSMLFGHISDGAGMVPRPSGVPKGRGERRRSCRERARWASERHKKYTTAIRERYLIFKVCFDIIFSYA